MYVFMPLPFLILLQSDRKFKPFYKPQAIEIMRKAQANGEAARQLMEKEIRNQAEADKGIALPRVVSPLLREGEGGVGDNKISLLSIFNSCFRCAPSSSSFINGTTYCIIYRTPPLYAPPCHKCPLRPTYQLFVQSI